MKYGWVKNNLVDLWTEPIFNSERASQLFFAEIVKVLDKSNGFLHVSQPDGYQGWIDERFVAPATKSVYDSYLKEQNSAVVSWTAHTYVSPKGVVCSPYFLYYGTRLCAQRLKNGFAEVFLPDNTTFLVKFKNVAPINTEDASRINSRMVATEACKFVGVPYLWGGITTAGFDCSGFVRTVLSRFGIDIPRDTKDQVTVGQQIDRDDIKTGDLIFFKRHVGLAIGKAKLVHSSVGGGGVRINSLVAGEPDYRKDLDSDYNQARRIACFS